MRNQPLGDGFAVRSEDPLTKARHMATLPLHAHVSFALMLAAWQQKYSAEKLSDADGDGNARLRGRVQEHFSFLQEASSLSAHGCKASWSGAHECVCVATPKFECDPACAPHFGAMRSKAFGTCAPIAIVCICLPSTPSEAISRSPPWRGVLAWRQWHAWSQGCGVKPWELCSCRLAP